MLGCACLPSASYAAAATSTIEQDILRDLLNDLVATPQHDPILILIGGYQGSGKTSLVDRIKSIYDINVISTDVIRQRLFDRGVCLSNEFPTYVKNIYTNLVRSCLDRNTSLVIDANAHGQRIEEIDRLLETENKESKYKILKIFLKATEQTLEQRILSRNSAAGQYQGTLADLHAGLRSAHPLPEYDYTIQTDKITEMEVFEQVNHFICSKTKLKVAPKIFIHGPCLVSQEVDHFDCHSSSVIETAPQVLCAVWKGGPGEGFSTCDIKQNVGIWSSHFENNQWSLPVQIVEAPDTVCWSPVLTKHPTGTLFLFYRQGADPRHTTSLFKLSLDGGRNWSDAAELPPQIIGPTKSKPVYDEDGNMICGSSREIGNLEDPDKSTACWIEILSPEGQWSRHGPIEIPGRKFGAIEPSLFFEKDGTLRMLCRDRANKIGLQGWIWTAESKDKGKTWSELQPTTLPNPDSGIDTLALRDGKVVVVYNHSHSDRSPLTIALWCGEGNSWMTLLNIEEAYGEFPSVTLDSQAGVHVLYAYTPPGKTQRQIKHMKITGL